MRLSHSCRVSLGSALDRIVTSCRPPSAQVIMMRMCNNCNLHTLRNNYRCVCGVFMAFVVIWVTTSFFWIPDTPPSVPSLGFNMQHIMSVGIGLSRLAADKIVKIKVCLAFCRLLLSFSLCCRLSRGCCQINDCTATTQQNLPL